MIGEDYFHVFYFYIFVMTLKREVEYSEQDRLGLES